MRTKSPMERRRRGATAANLGTRRWALSGAATVGGALLAGCGRSAPEPKAAASGPPVTLTMLHYQPIKKEQFEPIWPVTD